MSSKIVHLLTYEYGGAGISALRLHDALVSRRASSSVIVLSRRSSRSDVGCMPIAAPGAGPVACMGTADDALHRRAAARWEEIRRRHPQASPYLEMFTEAATGVDLLAAREFVEADIVNLHWTGGFLDIPTMRRSLAGKKVVWTLHDMAAFTGGCHYDWGCGRHREACDDCPLLGAGAGVSSAKEGFQAKASAYPETPFTVVSPSRWLADEARASTLFGRKDVRLIPYSLPLQIFRPQDKGEARAALGLPADRRIVLFGCDGLSNARKGLAFLLKALELLNQDGEVSPLCCFFGTAPGGLPLPAGSVSLGRIDDERILAVAYAAADVFVVPSLQDNLPNTVLESLSCGTPVAGFRVGGIPDMVEHETTGHLAEAGDSAGLAASIRWVLRNGGQSMREAARRRAESSWDPAIQADAYLDLYRSLEKVPEATESVAASPATGVAGDRPAAFDVTAIVSAYDSTSLLPACLDDLLDQTLWKSGRMEVIVVDTGSPGKEGEIVRRYQEVHGEERLRYVRTEERLTLYAAWNIGVAKARGRFVTNANTDDAHVPHALETMASALDATPEADFCFCDTCWTDVPNDRRPGNPSDRSLVAYPDRHPATAMTWCTFGPHPMWRKSLFDEIGSFDPAYKSAGDFEFELRLTAAGRRGVHVPEALSLFFQNSSGLSQAGTTGEDECRALLARWWSSMPIESLYKVEGPSERCAAWIDISLRALRCGAPWAPDHAFPELALIAAGRAWAEMPQDDFAQGLFVGLAQRLGRSDLIPEALRAGPAAGPRSAPPPAPPPAHAPLRWSREAGSSAVAKDEHAPVHWIGPILGVGERARIDRCLVEALELGGMEPVVSPTDNDPLFVEGIAGDRFALGRWQSIIQRPERRGVLVCSGAVADPARVVEDNPGHSAYVYAASAKDGVLAAGRIAELERFEEIWVPSTRDREAFVGVGVDERKIRIVPTCVDVSRWNHRVEPRALHGVEGVVLLAILESAEDRSCDIYVEAFVRAFAGSEGACLVLGIRPSAEGSPRLRNRLSNSISGFERTKSIIVLDEPLGEAGLPSVLATADLVLLPWRTDAAGTSILEAMAMEKPVLGPVGIDRDGLVDDTTGWTVPEEGGADGSALDRLVHLFRELPARRFGMPAMGRTGRARVARLASPDLSLSRMLGGVQRLGMRADAGSSPPIPPRGSTDRLRGVASKAGSIHWCAPILNFSGYARMNRDLVRSLDRDGIRPSVTPLDSDQAFANSLSGNKDDLAFWMDVLNRPENGEGLFVCSHLPPGFPGQVATNPAYRVHVGLTMFETDRLPVGWAKACESMDEIWVPSTFNRETFARGGLDPSRIQVVPYGIDLSRWDPSTVPMHLPGRRGTNLLAVFEWTRRKGWDILVEAFARAYGPDEDVSLTLRTRRPASDPTPIRAQIDAHLGARGLDPRRTAPILLLEEPVPDAAMPSLYAACDAVVLPTRGEGWGLPFMEAMAMERPVVATAWGAHMDFLDDEVGWTIPVEALEAVDAAQTRAFPLYGADHRWAKPSVEALVGILKGIPVSGSLLRTKGKAGRMRLAKDWTPERSALWIRRRAEHLLRQGFDSTGSTRSSSAAPAVMPDAPLQGVLIRSGFFDFSGYSRLARDTSLALRAAAHPTRIEAYTADPEFLKEIVTDPPTALALKAMVEHSPVDGIGIAWFPPTEWQGRDVYSLFREWHPGLRCNVAMTMFETDRISAQWADRCNAMDEVWVPSMFNVETFAASGVDRSRLRLIPLGLRLADYDPATVEPMALAGKKCFTFLSVFQWTYRKGWDLLLEAFAREFEKDAGVRLVLRTYPSGKKGPPIRQRIDEYLASKGLAKMSGRIQLIEEFVSDARMPSLLAACDAFVLPTRGEGWGIPFMEAMALGKPVVATRWSGHLEFMNDANSFLVDIDGLENVQDQMREDNDLYTADHRWAKPSMDHLRARMREVFSDPERARRVGALARAEVLRDRDVSRTAEWIRERAAELTGTLGGAPEAPPPSAPSRRRPVVAVDVRALFDRDSTDRGIGHYAHNHLKALEQAAPDHEFLFLGPDDLDETLVKDHLATGRVRTLPLSKFRPEMADRLHLVDPMGERPDGISPFEIPFSGPRTTVFYDLIPLRFYLQHWSPELRNAYLARLEQAKAFDGTHLCISESTREDLVACGASRAHAGWIGAGLNRAANTTPMESGRLDALLSRLGVTGPFFLHVGALDAHKNFQASLSCFLAVRERVPCQLVVVGRKVHSLGAWAKNVESRGLEGVVFTDFLSREDLEALYSRAVSLLFLSRIEGFGFPLLEAMAQGCPTIAYANSSLPEVGGDAAILVPDNDEVEVVKAMLELLGNPRRRQELARKGRARAEEFTWASVAERTLAAWSGAASAADVPAGVAKAPSATAPEPSAGAVRPRPQPVPVLWGAPVFDPSGYADEARGFLKGMEGLGISVSLREAGRSSPTFRSGLPASDRARLEAMLKAPAKEGSTAVVHLPAHGFQRIPGCGIHVGRTMFETDSLPRSWVEACNGMDEIWVPTDFNLRTFREAGVRVPLLKVPGGVDSDRFRPGLQPLPLPGRKAGTTYLSVFEWTARKGWDVLLAGWAKAFKPSDDVRLVLRAYPPNAIEGDPVAWIEERIDAFLATLGSSRAACAPILVLAAQVPDADMPRLYAAADVYLAPSRGEGWGRPHMEAMSCGVPVVATRWSGNLEFQSDDNSWLIDVGRLAPVGDDMAFEIYRGQRWAEPDLASFVDLLERSWKNRTERAAKSVRARKDVVERWDWRLVAPRAAARLKEISRGIAAEASVLNHPVPARVDATPPVRWCGPMFNFSGYARLAREAVSGLMDARLEVTADPLLNDPEWFDGLREDPTLVGRWKDLLRREPKEGVLVACDLPRSADGRHDVLAEIARANPGCPAMVAWTMFETDRLPEGWASSLNRMDQVWVPTRTGLEAFRRSGVDPAKLRLVPGGLDPSAYDPDRIRPSSLPGPARGTTFLSVFQWSRRKGWDTLLEGWSRAFAPTDDVRLVLRCHGAGPGPSVRERLASWLAGKGLTFASMAPIVLLEDFIPEPRMASLYAACDVFVLPTRGEGWGLPYLEAMASAKPCIATSWGGQTDFLHEGVAWMLPVSGMVAPDPEALAENPFLTPEHRWAEVRVEALVDALRAAHADPESRRRKGRQARREVLEKWTRAHTARAISAALAGLGTDRRGTADVRRVGGTRLSGVLAATARGLRTASTASRPGVPTPSPKGSVDPVADPGAPGAVPSLSIRWEGSQFVHHSLAHVNRAFCAGLAKAGHDLSLIPYEPDQFGPGADPDLRLLATLTGAPLEDACQVHVRHQWPPNLQAPSEGRWVVIQPWEFGSPPKEWIAAFRDSVDDLWAYTDYVRDMYLRAGMAPDRVHVVPLGVDCDRFRPGLAPLGALPPKRGVRFLYVGGTIARKGFDKLLNAWQKAFGPDDPVELLVKDMGGKTTYAGQTGEAYVRRIQESGRFATIHYVNTDLDPADLPSLYASGDVLVHPYRGEGFGLPIAEAMACGLPVVITEGGAADDFCGAAEGWMIPAEKALLPGGKVGDTETVEPAWWLEPSEEALVLALREAAVDVQARARKGNAARERILSGFTWGHAVAKAQERLVVVASRPVRRQVAKAPLTRVAKVPVPPSPPSEAKGGANLEDLSALLFQVETAVALQDSAQADSLSKEAVELHPDQPLAWLSRAMVLRGAGKSGKALEALTKSATLGGGAEVLYETMALHLQEGRNAPALVQWNLLRTNHAQWVKERKAMHQSQGLPWLPDRFAKPGKSPKKSAGKKR